MTRAPTETDPRAEEKVARSFWEAQGLPPSDGRLGPDRGALAWQVLAVPVGPEPGAQAWARLIVADADARYLMLRQQASRSQPCLSDSSSPPFPEAELRARGIWIRTSAAGDLPPAELSSRVNGMVERLAANHVLVVRDAPMRLCPRCREPRAPESILYNAEKGPSYLVRFPLRGAQPRTSLLVWTDALWKLLGATAILVNPDLRYAVVHYRRREVDDRIIVAEPALPRLSAWLPGATLEILETKAGEELADSIYDHPHGTDSPELAGLPGPAGSVLPSAEVGDSGTGIVALVPAHGASDAIVARSLRVPGFSVFNPVTTRLVSGPPKYTGLPLGIAEAMLLHDLAESGHLFAELRVRRGVPHCTTCGGEVIWAPGRTWCLEPGRMNDATAALFARLLPGEGLPRSAETVPWPVAELFPATSDDAPQFWECPVCERLGLPEEAAACSCGQTRQQVRRDLLPVFRRPLEAWARLLPLSEGDAVRIYVLERRKFPTLIHHLMAIEAARVETKSVRAVPLATLPFVPEVPDLGPAEPTDVFRATLLRASVAERTAWAFAQIRTQEARRQSRLRTFVESLIAELKSGGLTEEPGSLVAHISELLEEDRAFISTFERLRLQVLRLYDGGQAGKAYERLLGFLEHDFRETYLDLVRRRRTAASPSNELRSFGWTVFHVLERSVELLAPAVPYTAERMARELNDRPSSLFERPILPIVETLLDPTLERRHRQWRSIDLATKRIRSRLRLDPGTAWKRIVVLSNTEEVAADVSAGLPVLRRITGAEDVEAASPEHPWAGRQLVAHPNLDEIRRVYPGRERRIVKMMEQLPAARVREALRSDSLKIVLDGHTLPLRASMFEFAESIPTDCRPAPWRGGEVLVSGLPTPPETPELPLLTFDAELLVERVRRDLDRVRRRGTTVASVAVWTESVLAEELRKNHGAIARYLTLDRFEVAADSKGFVASERRSGRSGSGARWSYWVQGARLNRRPVKRRSRQRSPVRWAAVGEPEHQAAPGVDFASEEIQSRSAEVSALVEATDGALGIALIGPSKALSAWEAGYHDADQLLAAPYDRLVALPGFGHYTAAEILRHRGEPVPKPRNGGRLSREGGRVESAETLSPREPSVSVEAGEPSSTALLAEYVPTTGEGDRPVEAERPLPESLSEPAEPAVETGNGTEVPAPTSSATDSRALGTPPSRAGLTAPTSAISPSVRQPPTVARPVAVAAGAAVGVRLAGPRPAAVGPVLASETPLPVAVGAPPGVDSGVELVVGYSAEVAWRRFLDATSAGHRGLCLSRETPARMRTFVGSRDVDIVWVSNLGQADSLSPANVDGLRALLHQEVSERGITVVYIESFEYLLAIQTLERATAWLKELDQLARTQGVRVWIPLNPGLVVPPVYEQLVSTFRHSDA